MTTHQRATDAAVVPGNAELPWVPFEGTSEGRGAGLHGPEREIARLTSMLEAAPLPIVHIDGGRRVTHANTAWCSLAQAIRNDARHGDVVGRDYLELSSELSDGLALAVAGVLEALPRSPEGVARVGYRTLIDGTPHWFELCANRGSDGATLFHTDVSEERRAEVALRMRTIVASALAEHQPFVSACSRIAALLREQLAWDIAAVWVPNHWEQLVCSDIFVDVRLQGCEFESITRSTSFTRGTGLPGTVWQNEAPFWVHAFGEDARYPRLRLGRAIGLRSGFAVPLQSDGRVLAVLELFSTEKRAEDPWLLQVLALAGSALGAEELRARNSRRADGSTDEMTRSRFEAVLENTPGFIAAIDLHRRIQYLNRALPHMRRDEIVGSNWLRFVPEVEHEALNAKLDELFATGTPQHHEMSTLGPDGRQMWISMHFAAVRENGAIVAAAVSSQDSTELKRTQIEFAAAQRWVAVGTLAAGVAHEINTPIQFVSDNLHFIGDAGRRLLGLVQKLGALLPLIAEGAPEAHLRAAADAAAKASKTSRLAFLEAELPKAIEACSDGLGRVSTIVHSLKEFAHPAATEKELTDLNRVVQRSLTIAVNEYKYVADLSTLFGELPPVPCLISEIGQVVLNLVVNAAHAIGDVVKGTDQKGTLEVRTWCENGEAVIAIRDTGTGIDPAIRARIFDPFFTTKEVGKGTGQGLALARAVIKQRHGGSITFESTVGKGTTFFVRLPLGAEP